MNFPENRGFKELTRDTFPEWYERKHNDRWWKLGEYRLWYDSFYSEFELFKVPHLTDILEVVKEDDGARKEKLYKDYILPYVKENRIKSINKLL